jgi:hypothetical protein
MRLQIYLISILASLIAWGLMFDGTRDLYRSAWSSGVIPNFKIHSRVHHFLAKEIGRVEHHGA